MIRPLAIAACLALCACSTHSADDQPIPAAPLPKPAVQTIVKQVCIVPTPWTASDQASLASALAALPDGHVFWKLYNDWQRTRDEERACSAAQATP
jgi:hypothetical protein